MQTETRMNNTPTRWMKSVQISAKTDIGLRRANNQDSHLVVEAGSDKSWLNRGHLIVVADGMGAHAAGEVASQTATDTISMSYSKRVREFPPFALRQSVYDAHEKIREQSEIDEAFRDMGTTVDALLLLPMGAVVAHVGDSRVYRWRNHTIEQLTFDHSLVWEVCVAGNLPFDQAPSYIPRNQITRSLGPTERLLVDLEGPFPVELGDTFLACSDGLSGQLNDREIGQVLGILEPDDATELLINLANLRGGPDNITVVVVKTLPLGRSLDNSFSFPVSGYPALIITVLGLLGLFWGLFSSNFPVGLGGGILGILGAIAFLWSTRDYFFSPSPFHIPEKPFGGGPYTSYSCPPSKEFSDKLASILQQFRQVTQGDKWDIRWEPADAREKAGLTAVRSKDYASSIREFCLAINYLMSELKKQRPKRTH